jgi:hypothetical protein
MVQAKGQTLDVGRIGGRSRDTEIALGRLFLQDPLLGCLDGSKHRGATLVVEIDAGGQVDLDRAGVLCEGFVEPEYGVGGRRLDTLEHGVCGG